MKYFAFLFFVLVGGNSIANAGLIFSVDLDTSVAGIQTSRNVLLGSSFQVDVWMDLTGSSTLGGYNVSLEHSPLPDPILLSVSGRTDFTIPGWTIDANNGPFNARIENRIDGTALIPTPPQLSPISLAVSRITFNANAIGSTTLRPGVFDPFNAFLDGSFVPIDPAQVTFNSANLTITAVPEPSSMAFLGMAALIGGYRLRKRKKIVG